jgi:hypothetical protein
MINIHRTQTYAERRPAQIAAGAQPIPAKKRVAPIRVAWNACRPGDENLKSGKKPSWFRTEAKAHQANDRLASERAYRELVVHCDVCNGFHLQHVFASDLQKYPMLTFKLDELLPPQALISVIEAAIAHRAPQQDAPQAPFPAHMAVPDAREEPKTQPAAPAPTQAAIAPTLESWSAEAKRLSRTAEYQGFVIGDHLNAGFRQFGQPALREARKLWTNSHVWQLRRIAERFPSTRRLDGVRWHTYRKLFHFPDEIVDQLLPRAADGVSANRLYAEACELLGKDPCEHGKKKSVLIPASLHARLKMRAHGTVPKLVREVLERWLAS